MKKIVFFIVCQSFMLSVLPQSQPGISHQAVVRNAENQIVSNSLIGIRVSIIQNTIDGRMVYIETHSVTSNANGLISYIIGQGVTVYGKFADIEWEQGPYFIKTEVDPLGGTDYNIIGTSQIHCVPFSFVSNQSLGLRLRDANDIQYQIVVDTMGNLQANRIIGTPCPSTPTVTDIDNNVYNTLLLGDQCWMQENLKTTKYRNGTDIVYPGSNNVAWQNNQSGAYAWYENDVLMKEKYGALYNWHAVNNPDGICPEGWHVPDDEEWMQLVGFIGSHMEPNGDHLKSCRQVDSPLGGDCNTTEHPRWNSHEIHYGTDEYGFSGLPSGCRSDEGFYWYRGMRGIWWSTTEDQEWSAWVHCLWYKYGLIDRYNGDKKFGYSVRCLRD
ncbi:MAG: fibrobacter succinogenes major paralogous domain-containing protein [Bacteroidales bacterium]|nr:fibrobacter succinogenes major paralogous domain-containing protein [Bacteroidales bacterium]